MVCQRLPTSYTYRAEVPGRHIDHRCALDSAHGNRLWRSLLAEPAPPRETVTPPLPGDLFNDQRQRAGPAGYCCSPDGFPSTLAIPGALPEKRANGEGGHVSQCDSRSAYAWAMALAPVWIPGIARSLARSIACMPARSERATAACNSSTRSVMPSELDAINPRRSSRHATDVRFRPPEAFRRDSCRRRPGRSDKSGGIAINPERCLGGPTS